MDGDIITPFPASPEVVKDATGQMLPSFLKVEGSRTVGADADCLSKSVPASMHHARSIDVLQSGLTPSEHAACNHAADADAGADVILR